jgi:hypothetical protein
VRAPVVAVIAVAACTPKPRTPQPISEAYKRQIRQRVHDRASDVNACFDKALADHPGLTGTVMVSFAITPAGTVTNAVGTGMTAEINGCIVDVLSRLTFPLPPGGGMTVTYPFSLTVPATGSAS